MKYLLGIIFFGILIFIHELGHFTVAKAIGVVVQKFSIGFGQSIFKWIKNGTEYMISIIPLGGYVKLQGDEITKEEYVEGDFYYANWKKRILLVIAGPLMNILLAYVMFSAYFYVKGFLLINEKPIIGDVIPKNPANIAGILKGDKILQINNMKIKNWYEMAGIISKYPGKKIKIILERNNVIMEKYPVPFKMKEDGSGKIGIRPDYINKKVGFFESIYYGSKTANLMIVGIGKELKKIISKKEKLDFMGPIGIVQISYQTIKNDFSDFFFLIGAMSLSIGIINLFPIPILDGGHVLLNLIEGIRRKRASEKTMKILNLIGIFILLMILFSASISDIKRLILD